MPEKRIFGNFSIGDWVIVFLCCVLILSCILPILSLLARSLSTPDAILLGQVTFVPVGFNLNAYHFVIRDPRIIRALVFTVILTAVFTVTAMFLTIILAFPLTYNSLKGRKIINFMVIFTLYFSVGIIPTYLLYRDLNLLNNPLVLVLPNAINVINMLIMRTFFFNIPMSLRESASMDGAGPVTILLKIYLPLSTAVIATLSLFFAVGRWNGFYDAVMFIQNRMFHPIQVLLYNVLDNNVQIGSTASYEGFTTPGRPETMRAASVMVTMLPILMVYPFLQKYFIKGATLGALVE